MFLGRPDREGQAVMDTTEMIDSVTEEISDEQQLGEQLLKLSLPSEESPSGAV